MISRSCRGDAPMSLFAALVITEILLGFSSSNAVPHSGLQTKNDATSAMGSLRLRGGGLFKKMKRGQPLSQAEKVWMKNIAKHGIEGAFRDQNKKSRRELAVARTKAERRAGLILSKSDTRVAARIAHKARIEIARRMANITDAMVEASCTTGRISRSGGRIIPGTHRDDHIAGATSSRRKPQQRIALGDEGAFSESVASMEDESSAAQRAGPTTTRPPDRGSAGGKIVKVGSGEGDGRERGWRFHDALQVKSAAEAEYARKLRREARRAGRQEDERESGAKQPTP